jgi:hypothetical protein
MDEAPLSWERLPAFFDLCILAAVAAGPLEPAPVV